MKLTPTGKQIIHDSPADRFGVYVWEMPNGSYIMDQERNFLNIPSEYGDRKRIAKLREAAKSFGITEGRPIFFPGHRQVNDEEYEIQRERMRLGLVPDTEDVGSLIEDLRTRK